MRGVLAIVAVVFVVVSFLPRDSPQSENKAPVLESRPLGRAVATKERRIPMKKCAKATFEIKSWDEEPYNEIEGAPKLTRAKVVKAYRGDIEGESTVEYLMMHRQDETASFVGLERVVGSLFGRSGSFVLQHEGTFEGGTAKIDWLVVPGSGTGELSGLRGEGSFAVGHAAPHAVTLEFDFE